MSRPPERPARPWWVVPALVVLAFFGVVFLVRTIIGLVAGVFTFVVVIALIVAAVYYFTTRD